MEPSEEIAASYLEKADGCVKSARILLPHKLFENSISMSYYAMYNALTALLFKTGIKSENHSASIVLLRNLYKQEGLYEIISSAKRERIDKQYYVSSPENSEHTKESAEKMMGDAEKFVTEIKVIMRQLKNSEIEALRKNFDALE